MRERYRTRRFIAAATAALLGGALLAGCGSDGKTNSDEKPEPTKAARVTKVKCRAPVPKAWQGMPPGLDAAAYAGPMDVTEAEVRKGRYGPAICDRAITPAEIKGYTPILDVRNIGSICLPTGFSSDAGPSRNVWALCAAVT